MGYLYVIDEIIREEDAYMHPRTTMPEGLEWLTDRDLKVKLIKKTYVKEDEMFTVDELRYITSLHRRQAQ